MKISMMTRKALFRYSLMMMVLACLSGCIFTNNEAIAATYYVATNGSDTNDGSINNPWKTISKALNTGPGDTVNVRSGTYTGTVEMIGRGGSSSGWWTLQSYPGETATLTGNYFSIYSTQYVRIQNLNFTNGDTISVGTADWIGGARSHHIEIKNNTFSGPQVQYGFIELMADDSLIEGNTITISASGGTMDHGIYLHYGANNTVRNNTISGPMGYGIHCYDEAHSNYPAGAAAQGYQNVVIEGNTITGSRERSGIILATFNNFVMKNVIVRNNALAYNNFFGLELLSGDGIQVYNNTFYNNGAQGIAIGEGGYTPLKNVQIKNNLVVTADATVCKVSCSWYSRYHMEVFSAVPGLTIDNNFYSPATIGLNGFTDAHGVTAADPMVVSTTDLHLRAGSPAIDRGLTLPDVPSDKDGVVRPRGSAYDIGAFEYTTTGSDTRPPSLPNNFRIR